MVGHRSPHAQEMERSPAWQLKTNAMLIQSFAQHLSSRRQTRHLNARHQVTKKSGGAHMKSISSVTAAQGTSLMIGSGPNANSKRSVFSHETGIAFNNGSPRLRKLKLIFDPWKRRKGEANDDNDDFSNRDRHSFGDGCDRVYTPIAQKQGADPAWRRQEDSPLGI